MREKRITLLGQIVITPITRSVMNYSHPVTLNFILIASVPKTWKNLEAKNLKDAEMTEKISVNQCQYLTQGLTIELPCQIVERVERYAKKNGLDVAGVLIEALDTFLRKQD